MTSSSIEGWAAKVPPALRCGSCDQPMGLGDFANYKEVLTGETYGLLSVSCDTYYYDATKLAGLA